SALRTPCWTTPWTPSCPCRSPRPAALAIAGLSVAVTIAIALTGLGAIATAGATVGTVTTTVAGATATTSFGPVAAGAIATIGLAVAFTLATHFVAGLAGCLAFFFAQFAIAILVELLEHSRHPT